MSDTGIRQRLAAILAADGVGYSRLMALDERATLTALDAARAVFRCAIESHQGRVIDMAGDSVLAVFDTATGAVSASLVIQAQLAAHSSEVPGDSQLQFRIGVHLGDVIEKADGTVYGDGVNIAARLQGLAEPGGVTVSDSIRSAVRGKVSTAFDDQGEQSVKNIAEPVRAFRLKTTVSTVSRPTHMAKEIEQEIRFCRNADGVRLAYSSIGNGSTVVKTGNWLTHLEYDLISPFMRGHWIALAKDHTLIRYDPRGSGLSDWDFDEMSLDSFVSDLETVVDASGAERFALLGISQGCAVSIAYAARHPDRVTRLFLFGGFAQGFYRRPHTEAQKQSFEAVLTLIRLGWGQDNPAFRQMFTSQFAPDATKEQADWFNDMQRIAVSPENAVRYMNAVAQFDVSELLPQVKAPTLVCHSRDDARVPFDLGRRIAGAIPGARLVPLQSRNHILLPTEPAFARFDDELQHFLSSKLGY